MTKSRGLGRGGRREGAGRPKIEKGKAATFATRITQRTRDLLDAEAEHQGKSVAAVAERLLRTALEKKAAEETRPHELRRLFNLIETLPLYLSKPHHWDDPKYDWHSNPYLFEAFRLAIGYLMTVMRPEGEIVIPPPPKSDNQRTDDSPFAGLRHAQTEYPESVDEHARDIALSVIGRAREQMRIEDKGKRAFLAERTDWEWAILGDDDNWELRSDHLLAEAARTLFDRGKK